MRGLYISYLMFAVLTFPLIYEYLHGRLSSRTFVAGVLVSGGCVFLVLWKRYRDLAANRDAAQSVRQQPAEIRKTRRKLTIIVVMMQIALYAGLWSSKGEYGIPTLVGATVNISITCVIVFLLFRTRRVGH